MGAGDLDRRVSIRRGTVFPGGLASETVWTTLVEVCAAFAPVSDAERQRAQQTGASLTARFTIRWSPEVEDVNPRDRLVFEGVGYGIEGVKALGRREWLEISATAIAERPVP